MFRALALHLHGNKQLEKEASKIFNLFRSTSEERYPSKFQCVHMTDFPKMEDLLKLNIFLYDIDFVDGELIGELARRSIQKFENSVKLLRYNNHICYVNKINVLLKAFQCTTCDTFFSKTGNLERHLVTCTDRVKHIYPKNVYELRETLFEKLDAFNIPYRKEQKLFKNLAIFDFESICVIKTLTSKQKLQRGSGSMCLYQFPSVKLDPGTHFSLQRQSASCHLVLYYCSRRISNSEQSSDEIDFYWSRDCNQDKTVCCTGTTKTKTQPRVELCRWLYRGGGGKRFIYTIPANAKESIVGLTGTFWALL